MGERAVKWASPEVFYPNNEQVFADLSTDRGPLALIRSYGAERCKHRFFGSGISALVKACGDYTALRVRAVRLKRGSPAAQGHLLRVRGDGRRPGHAAVRARR